MKYSRKEVLDLRRRAMEGEECPRCNAPKGVPCLGLRGPRKSVHLQRLEALRGHEITPWEY